MGKIKNSGFFVFFLVCTLMLALTILQIAFSDGEKGLALRIGAVNIILGAGGMCALLLFEKKQNKKFKAIENIIRPFGERNYSALAAAATEMPGGELYDALRKTSLDLEKFIGAFNVHAGTCGELEELLKHETGMPVQNTNDQTALDGRLAEINEAAEQGMQAIDEVEKYFSSSNELSNEQAMALKEAEAKLAITAELSKSIAVALEESGKVSLNLRGKINAGDEESKNAYDIIKSTSRELEKIIEMAEVINEISDKTNILSMNAAIESAHAGAAGAGFAVVSDEIRKLADMTRENAEDIQKVLKIIAKQIAEALKASEKSSESYSLITGELTAFLGSLETAAQDARNNSEAGQEVKAALAGSADRAGVIRDSSMNIAVIGNSFRSAFESIQSISGNVKDEVSRGSSGNYQNTDYQEKLMDKIRDYLGETSDLKCMLFPPQVKENIFKTAENKKTAKEEHSDRSFKLSFKKDPKLANTTATVKTDEVKPKTDSHQTAAVKQQAAPAAAGAGASVVADADNSWRKDVNVKSPPQTVL